MMHQQHLYEQLRDIQRGIHDEKLDNVHQKLSELRRKREVNGLKRAYQREEERHISHFRSVNLQKRLDLLREDDQRIATRDEQILKEVDESLARFEKLHHNVAVRQATLDAKRRRYYSAAVEQYPVWASRRFVKEEAQVKKLDHRLEKIEKRRIDAEEAFEEEIRVREELASRRQDLLLAKEGEKKERILRGMHREQMEVEERETDHLYRNMSATANSRWKAHQREAFKRETAERLEQMQSQLQASLLPDPSQGTLKSPIATTNADSLQFSATGRSYRSYDVTSLGESQLESALDATMYKSFSDPIPRSRPITPLDNIKPAVSVDQSNEGLPIPDIPLHRVVSAQSVGLDSDFEDQSINGVSLNASTFSRAVSDSDSEEEDERDRRPLKPAAPGSLILEEEGEGIRFIYSRANSTASGASFNSKPAPPHNAVDKLKRNNTTRLFTEDDLSPLSTPQMTRENSLEESRLKETREKGREHKMEIKSRERDEREKAEREEREREDRMIDDIDNALHIVTDSEDESDDQSEALLRAQEEERRRREEERRIEAEKIRQEELRRRQREEEESKKKERVEREAADKREQMRREEERREQLQREEEERKRRDEERQNREDSERKRRDEERQRASIEAERREEEKKREEEERKREEEEKKKQDEIRRQENKLAAELEMRNQRLIEEAESPRSPRSPRVGNDDDKKEKKKSGFFSFFKKKDKKEKEEKTEEKSEKTEEMQSPILDSVTTSYAPSFSPRIVQSGPAGSSMSKDLGLSSGSDVSDITDADDMEQLLDDDDKPNRGPSSYKASFNPTISRPPEPKVVVSARPPETTTIISGPSAQASPNLTSFLNAKNTPTELDDDEIEEMEL
ncbi:hypothetical protein PROFUN_01240 [Planoprotostelium fungivorum]|uniref:Uncharacterized protein n=1 Tax=Planoprotostelium fungivorum TaxID=1890364 RepID=A0A2P6NZK4_9EUKA|nr:hypothetical protein PROFUN_01240 [Planoprotostelium fungivorum]